jgi:hypothetical protein
MGEKINELTDREVLVLLHKKIDEFRQSNVGDVEANLHEWEQFFSGWVAYISKPLKHAEHEYWRVYKEARKSEACKTKADAEIEANATPEYDNFKEFKHLREDLTILLSVLKGWEFSLNRERGQSGQIF